MNWFIIYDLWQLNFLTIFIVLIFLKLIYSKDSLDSFIRIMIKIFVIKNNNGDN